MRSSRQSVGDPFRRVEQGHVVVVARPHQRRRVTVAGECVAASGAVQICPVRGSGIDSRGPSQHLAESRGLVGPARGILESPRCRTTIVCVAASGIIQPGNVISAHVAARSVRIRRQGVHDRFRRVEQRHVQIVSRRRQIGRRIVAVVIIAVGGTIQISPVRGRAGIGGRGPGVDRVESRGLRHLAGRILHPPRQGDRP